MTDLKLDPLTHDLPWDEGGLLQLVDGEDEIIQRLKVALWTQLGEYRFDTSAGVDYLSMTRRKPRNLAADEAEFRRVATNILGPDSVRAIEFSENTATRELTVTMDTVYGEVEVTV